MFKRSTSVLILFSALALFSLNSCKAKEKQGFTSNEHSYPDAKLVADSGFGNMTLTAMTDAFSVPGIGVLKAVMVKTSTGGVYTAFVSKDSCGCSGIHSGTKLKPMKLDFSNPSLSGSPIPADSSNVKFVEPAD